MKRSALLAAALAAFGLSACVAVKNPIGTSVGYVNDPALEGTWRGSSDEDRPNGYFHVIANDDATMTVVGFTPKGPKDKAEWGTLSLTTVTLGPNRYMNVRETGENGGPPKDSWPAGASIPLLYRIDGNTLRIFTLDEKKTADAIRAKKIEGTVTTNKVGSIPYDTVAITADGPHLDAYLARPDAANLFTPFTAMTRERP